MLDFALDKKIVYPVKKIQSSISQSFVYAANTAADITVDICSFVVLFSVVTAFTDKMQRVKPLFYPLEITNALTKTHNLYIISFLLGFGGICIWFQIFSVGKELKIEIKSFALMRILHGAISTVVTALLLEIHIIAAPTFSNNKSFVAEAFVSGKTLGVSLIVMAVIFIISLSNKEGKIKILEEFI